MFLMAVWPDRYYSNPNRQPNHLNEFHMCETFQR